LRNALTIAVLAVWVTMLVLLVRREAPPASTSLDEVGDLAALPPRSAVSAHGVDAGPDAGAGDESDGATADRRVEWFSIVQAGRKIGWTRRTTERDAAGWTFHDDSGFTLAMLGVPQTLRTTMQARTDSGYGLTSFEFKLLSPATRFQATGSTDGKKLVVHYGPRAPSTRRTYR
jgi:hypothetical protein